jgi:23S rRNA (guanine1835-N2)-methyltransferase
METAENIVPIEATLRENSGKAISLVSTLLGELPAAASGGRCWDGADRLLLETLFRESQSEGLHDGPDDGPGENDALLLMNDDQAALLRVLTNWAALKESKQLRSLQSFSDDVRVGRFCATEGEGKTWLSFVPSTDQPASPTVVLLRIPAIESILRAQIVLLSAMAARGDQFLVIGAGLDRLLPPKAKQLLSVLGPVQTLPGAYKSHAFVCRVTGLEPGRNAADGNLIDDRNTAADLQGADKQMTVEAGPNTLSFASGPYAFSAGRLDLGSRLLIEAITAAASFGQTALRQPGRVADLACGNGVVGVMAHYAHKLGEVYFSDVSLSAVALAKRNAAKHGVDCAEFAADTGFDTYRGARFDAVVLNPPFHSQGGVDEELGTQLFVSAHGNLRVGGELWVVGNRHLGYQTTMQSLFGNCRLVTAHPKFVVLVARREATRLRPLKLATLSRTKEK